MSSSVDLLVFTLALLAGVIGLFLLAFVRGWRRRGAAMLGASFVSIFVAALIFGPRPDRPGTIPGVPSPAAAPTSPEPGPLPGNIAAPPTRPDPDVIAGFHCLSAWDGSHRMLVAALKLSLREPDSFEHIRTVIAPVDANGQHQLRMEYRARNGFGGMNIGTVWALVDNDTCLAIITDQSEQ